MEYLEILSQWICDKGTQTKSQRRQLRALYLLWHRGRPILTCRITWGAPNIRWGKGYGWVFFKTEDQNDLEIKSCNEIHI